MVRITTLFGLGFMAATAFAVPTRRLLRRDSDCPFTDPDTTTRFSFRNTERFEYVVEIKFLEAGEGDCTYNVVRAYNKTPNAPPFHGPTSAKTPKIDPGRPQWFSKNELNALKGIKEFVAHGRDVETDREWLITKQHQGKHLMLTEAWNGQFGGHGYNTDTTEQGVRQCKAFMRQAYTLVADQAAWYVKNYGWVHNSFDWNNFKFSDDFSEVQLVNWAQSEYIDEPEQWETYSGAEKFKISGALEYRSRLPILDFVELPSFKQIQGVCESRFRKFDGDDWANPYPTVFKSEMCDTSSEGSSCAIL